MAKHVTAKQRICGRCPSTGINARPDLALFLWPARPTSSFRVPLGSVISTLDSCCATHTIWSRICADHVDMPTILSSALMRSPSMSLLTDLPST